jgi:hypothetical protein
MYRHRVVAASSEWVLLAYRLPREPSGPRVTVWRKLRRLRVVQLVDGLVGLPASAQNREQLDWIADEVLDAGGEAWTWIATPGTKAQQRALAAKLADTAAEDHNALLDEAEAVLAASDRPHRRTLKRLHDELRILDAEDSARRRRVLKQLGEALAPSKAAR